MNFETEIKQKLAKSGRRQEELREQIKVFDWARKNEEKYPRLKLLFAIPNGGSRNIAEAVCLKMAGVKSGMPDICLPVSVEFGVGEAALSGLWIEMKWGKGRLSRVQKQKHGELNMQGHKVVTCYSAEAAIKAIKDYLHIL